MEKRPLRKLSELSDADLDTDELDKAWESVESNFLEPHLASMVGYLAAFWSAIEVMLLVVLRATHKLPDTSFTILVAETSFLQRKNMIASSFSMSHDRTFFDEWCDFENHLNDLRNRRNHIIHGFWMRDETAHLVTRISSRRKPDFSTTTFTAREIQKLNVLIVRAYRRLTVLTERLEKINLSLIINKFDGKL